MQNPVPRDMVISDPGAVWFVLSPFQELRDAYRKVAVVLHIFPIMKRIIPHFPNTVDEF
jgi:hypothetical protein